MPEPSSGFDLQPSSIGKSTRVDSAHGYAEESNGVVSRDELATIAGVNAETSAQQLERQTAEISGHLMPSEPRELDWKEAELNARLALLENQLRVARLKARQAAANEETNPPPDTAGQARFAQKVESDPQVQRDETHPPELGRLDADLLSGTNDAGLDHFVTDVADTPQPPFERPSHTGEQRAPEDDRHDLQQHKAEDDLKRKRVLLQRRKEELDRRRASVEKMYAETLLMHREAMEMRLVTEQLWANLSNTVDPAALTKSLSSLRAKLAQQYRKQNQWLSLRQAELNELRDQLNKKQQWLRCHAEKFRQWLYQRHEQTEIQTLRELESSGD